jgi:hypothetical protein
MLYRFCQGKEEGRLTRVRRPFGATEKCDKKRHIILCNTQILKLIVENEQNRLLFAFGLVII